MTTDQLCKNLIGNYQSDDVQESIKLAEYWTSIVTGDNQDEIVVKLRDKETKTQKEQRIRVFNSLTPYIVSRVKKVFKQGSRADGIIDKLMFDNDPNGEGEAIKMIKERANNFYGNSSVKNYIDKAFLKYSFSDANTMLVTKIHDFNPLVDQPFCYPEIVESKHQMTCKYVNGVLLGFGYYDHVKVDTIQHSKGKTVLSKRAIYYSQGLAQTVRLLEEGEQNRPEPYNRNNSEGYYITVQHDNKNYTAFAENYITGSERVPAVRLGYMLCESNNNIYDSVLCGARNLFNGLINSGSAYDTHMAVHGILQKFIYQPRCTYKDPDTHVTCQNGYVGGLALGATDGNKCPACQGTGKQKFHQSEQDIISLTLPNDNTEIFDLSKLVHYQTVDTELIRMHKEERDEYGEKVYLSIFNTNMFDRAHMGGTATEINANLTYKNNEIYDFEVGKGIVWEHIHTQIAIYTENDKGFTAKRLIPSSFNLETLSDWLLIREKASTSGASKAVLQSIDLEIAKKQNSDSPEEVDKMQAIEVFRPFTSMGESERISLVTLLPDNDTEKLRYLYFDELVRYVNNSTTLMMGEESTNIPFYKLPYDKREIVVNTFLSSKVIDTQTVRLGADEI